MSDMKGAKGRAKAITTVPGSGTVLEAAGVRVDTVRRIAERDGAPVRLTAKEYGVLELLLVAAGGWVTVEELLDDVWPSPDERGRGVGHRRATLAGRCGHGCPGEDAAGVGDEQRGDLGSADVDAGERRRRVGFLHVSGLPCPTWRCP